MQTIQKLPAEVNVGDIIVSRSDKARKPSTHKVEKFSLCGSKWRTHIHLDGGCYDGRIPVSVAV